MNVKTLPLAFDRKRSVLGLEMDRHGATAVELHRNGTGAKCGAAHRAELSVDLLTGDAELGGRELRNRLDAAGIRTRRCAVCIPLDWVMVHTVELPDVSEEDIASFIALEAERTFPFAPEELSMAVSRYTAPDGAKGATIGAIPRNTMAALEAVLRHARLAPVSITVGAPLLAESETGQAAALSAGARTLEFAFVRDGGVAALRAFALPEGDDSGNYEELERELRITFRRLPGEALEGMESVRLFGADSRRREAKEGLEPCFGALGLALVEDTTERPEAAVRAGAAWLSGRGVPLEFLKPRVTRMQQELQRLMQRGLLMRAGVALGAAVLLFATLLVYRQARAAHLERKWNGIAADVRRVEALQSQIRAWRPWFDNRPASLDILAALTRAFPESGNVWARTIEVKDLAHVTCSGNARSNDDCLRLLDALRATAGVADLKVLQMRGENPVQFSLEFKWTGGAGDGA